MNGLFNLTNPIPPELQALEEYGVDLKEVDWVKIEFYQLLDEFF
jgi:hypothetical protein